MQDAGEPGSQDAFAIAVEDSNGKVVYEARGTLGSSAPGGGNIQLHRPNAASTAPASAPPPPANDPF